MSKHRGHSHYQPCTRCGTYIKTTSYNPGFVCAPCRRAAGMAVHGRISGSTPKAAPPMPVLSHGRCQSCSRVEPLANGRCEDCRFYGIAETDAELSARGRKAQGGVNDWVRRRRA